MDAKYDPLYYGTVNVSGKDVPSLQGGSKILKELDKLSEENKFLGDILHGPDDTVNFVQTYFPEIVSSNDIGNLKKGGFNSWEPNNNDITIEVDPDASNNKGAKDVYIGGPAALFAAAIQANNKTTASDILYGHDGMRGLSNWKGSASYFHIRDAIPVYYWPDNSGIYTLYCSAKHFLQKRLTPNNYKKEFNEDPNFNKLRLNVKCLIREPLLIPQVFVKNVLRTIKDVNLHLTKTHLIEPTKSTAYVTMEHARLTKEIIPNMDLEKPILMTSNASGKALHLHLGDGAEESKNVFRNLQRIAGDTVRYTHLSDEELSQRGYDIRLVQQGVEFPNDGYIVPYADQQLGKSITKNGGEINNRMRLKKVLVAQTEDKNDYRATKIVWEDIENGRSYTTAVKTLYLSLGPSVRNLKVSPPKYSLFKHACDIFKAKIAFTDIFTPRNVAYQPNLQSLFTNIANRLSSSNLLHKTMWASGLSSTVLIKVDKSKVEESNMIKFRDHIDAHNKHCVRLAEKEVIIDGRAYQMFILQLTGGGHFPIKDVHSEAAINVLKANFIPLLNLHQEGVEFELISARSCARGISAQNVFRMKAPLSNTVMIYGIGGIGMTTMAGNALLMKALLKERENLSKGEITAAEFHNKMKESDFSSIPHWQWGNPFSRNYAQFIDSVADPREVARKLGLNNTGLAIKTVISARKDIYMEHSLKILLGVKNILLKFVK